MVVAVSPGAGSGQRGGGGQHSSALSQRTDSTLPQHVKLPSGVQRYPPRPIILPHLQRGCIRGPVLYTTLFYSMYIGSIMNNEQSNVKILLNLSERFYLNYWKTR
jgi:hypothetical protein